MGFLDDLKKGADNLGNKLNDSFSGQSGPTQSQADPLLRDLGALTFLDQTGRLTEDQQPHVVRILSELQALEAQGLVIDLALRSAPPPPPGAAVGATPPPPAGAAAPVPPPPAGGAVPPPPPPAGVTTAPPPAPAAPAPVAPPPAPATVTPPPAPGGAVPPPPSPAAVIPPPPPPGVATGDSAEPTDG